MLFIEWMATSPTDGLYAGPLYLVSSTKLPGTPQNHFRGWGLKLLRAMQETTTQYMFDIGF